MRGGLRGEGRERGRAGPGTAGEDPCGAWSGAGPAVAAAWSGRGQPGPAPHKGPAPHRGSAGGKGPAQGPVCRDSACPRLLFPLGALPCPGEGGPGGRGSLRAALWERERHRPVPAGLLPRTAATGQRSLGSFPAASASCGNLSLFTRCWRVGELTTFCTFSAVRQ